MRWYAAVPEIVSPGRLSSRLRPLSGSSGPREVTAMADLVADTHALDLIELIRKLECPARS
jgi:hypothetical protein